MTEPADMSFLSEGIARYAQAVETIEAFQTLLEERLRNVLAAYEHNAFTPTRAKLESGTGGDADGKWIWASRQGKLRSHGTLWLELGLWWRGAEVAYYCDFCEDNSKAIEFTYKGNRSGIEFKKWSKRARLFMLTSKDRYVSMDEDCKILLDELTSSF